MKKIIRLFLLPLVFSCLVVACNSDEGNTTVENTDPGNVDSMGAGQTNNNNVDNAGAAFISESAYGDLKEIEAGKVAQAKGQSPAIRELANMMVADHTAMSQQIKALAVQKNIALRDTLSAEDRDMIRENKKTGAAFDREYADMMVSDHESAVRRFENAANNAKDPEIKAMATEALPKLKHHLEMSKVARDKVKG